MNSKDRQTEMKLSDLRLQQDFVVAVGSKETLTTVPVRRPTKSEFIRVHEGSEYVSLFGLIDISVPTGRETYLIVPGLAQAHADLVTAKYIFLAQNTEGATFLLPARNPNSGGKSNPWNESLFVAIEKAKTGWVRIASDQSLGAYRCFPATAKIHDPTWPSESFEELIRIGFNGFIIDSPTHPVLRKLREGA